MKFTLNEPIEELQGTDCEFTYERVYAPAVGRGRRPLVALKFFLKHTALKQIPQHWRDKSPEHKKVIEEMTNVWQVDEKNFIDYIEFVKLDGAKKLMAEWAKKEHSNKPIQNRKLYCNASFVAEAKK